MRLEDFSARQCMSVRAKHGKRKLFNMMNFQSFEDDVDVALEPFPTPVFLKASMVEENFAPPRATFVIGVEPNLEAVLVSELIAADPPAFMQNVHRLTVVGTVVIPDLRRIECQFVIQMGTSKKLSPPIS